ncbi:MAG TPA: endolytic transglycosylase MltG [Arenimonas sp.]|uniref:endolytic transglycosylase MltG n=1 Tax=Arenimonas sp. TaxID=1872635 RepID=UPI002CE1CF01|nr:endolytic transglycosylase MltG [Arenimonas sp.]HMB55767.1 endolytic transglycosylase MltG [Arenimonas sp.]
MPRQRRIGRIKLFFAVLLVAAVAAAGIWWQRTQEFADRPLLLSDVERVLMIEQGDGFNRVLEKIRGLGVEQGSDLEWKTLATTMKVAQRLQVGDYAVTSGMTPRALLMRLENGEVIQRKFTIIEGWNFRDLRKGLAGDILLKHEIEQLSDTEVMKKLDRDGVFPEGRFLPETYVYTRGTSDLAILDRAAKAMDEKLAEAWQSRRKDLPLATPDQLLTLASIVEKETGKASERPQIAGVFIRRLNTGMRLQTDPTVIYGMGSAYAGNIRKTDLLTDTPYNTYTRDGLPPTPIAMPGKEALAAAANPADGDALYFVARGNGAHYFSATLAEHNAAVRKYQLGQ